MYVYIHKYIFVHISILIYTLHMYKCIYVCIQTYIYTYTFMYTYIYICRHHYPAHWQVSCSTIQHSATKCNTLQRIRLTHSHTTAHCNTLPHTAAHLSHARTHCNTLQHTTKQCNTLVSRTHTQRISMAGIFSRSGATRHYNRTPRGVRPRSRRRCSCGWGHR